MGCNPAIGRGRWGRTISIDGGDFAPGGYRFIKAVFQYSGGVAAEPGIASCGLRFQRPLPLAEASASPKG